MPLLTPTAASVTTCVLSNSTYKLTLSTDMVIEIQITKLPAKFLTEGHWRWIISRLKHVTHLNLISYLTIQSIHFQQQRQENFVVGIR